MRVRQPGMERHQRHLDNKGDQEGTVEPEGLAAAEDGLLEGRQGKGVVTALLTMQPVKGNDAEQHQQ